MKQKIALLLAGLVFALTLYGCQNASYIVVDPAVLEQYDNPDSPEIPKLQESQESQESTNSPDNLASSDNPANPVTVPDNYADYVNRDVRDDIFYFVLPDRFENGDPANDQGAPEGLSHGGFDPTDKGMFHGGDLAGLKEKLPYLKDLGVTAVWLTPILRNMALQFSDGWSSGYHGYWILDFTQLDPHLGTNAELKDFIDSAHQVGMKVFFDIIVNHTADVIKYRECHHPDGSFINKDSALCPYKTKAQLAAGDTYTPFILGDQKNAKVPAWLNDPKYYSNQGDSTWQGESAVWGDFAGLDDVDTSQPEVVQGFIDIYNDIISKYRPDGFRIDTVKHVNIEFWSQFSPAIMERAHAEGIPNFHVFGEVYDSTPELLSTFTTIGKMPAILDFGFQRYTHEYLVENKSPAGLARLFDKDDYYNDADSDASLLPTFIGNHDMGRFGFFLNSSLPKAKDAEKTQRVILAHALMYFARGIPVIYYGDEQGYAGDGNDKDAREDMMPSEVPGYNDNDLFGTDATTAEANFDQGHPIYQALARFADIYKGHRALRQGIHLNRYVADGAGIYAFSRVDPVELKEYLVAFNSALAPQKVTLKTTAASYSPVAGANQKLVAGNGQVSLSLQPLSFVIYAADTGIAPVVDWTLALTGAEMDQGSPDFIHLMYGVKPMADQALPVLRVTTEYIDATGAYQLGAVDYTPPYSARILATDIAGGLKGRIRVTVDNLNGLKRKEEFNLAAE